MAHLRYRLSNRLPKLGDVRLEITITLLAKSPRVFVRTTRAAPRGLVMWVHLNASRAQRYCYYDGRRKGGGFRALRIDPQTRVYQPTHYGLPARRYITLYHPNSPATRTLYPMGQPSKVSSDGNAINGFLFFNHPFAVEALVVPEGQGEAFVQHRSQINAYHVREEFRRISNQTPDNKAIRQ